MSREQYEAEARFLVANIAELDRRLASQGAIAIRESKVTDEWFVPSRIRTYLQHEGWLRGNSAVPIRLRTFQDSGRERIAIEVKRPVVPGRYTISKEITVEIGSAESARSLLEELGLRALIVLEKLRTTYKIGDICECHVDDYGNSAIIMELEAVTRDPIVTLPRTILELGGILSEGIATPLERSAALYFIEKTLRDDELE